MNEMIAVTYEDGCHIVIGALATVIGVLWRDKIKTEKSHASERKTEAERYERLASQALDNADGGKS